MLEIKSPTTDSDWKAYYALRFNVLREPWNQPLGSEVLADEDQAIHAIAVKDGVVLGVARMHESAEKQGQVRCVATATAAQGKGIGKAIMAYLEEKAKQKKVENDATSLQSTFLNAFRNELQTDSPYKRNIMVNDIQEATKQYTDLLSTIDSMDGIERARTHDQMP